MTTLSQIRDLCQQNAHAGVNPGAHALACEILKLLRNERICDEAGLKPGRTYEVDGDLITERKG